MTTKEQYLFQNFLLFITSKDLKPHKLAKHQFYDDTYFGEGNNIMNVTHHIDIKLGKRKAPGRL